MSAVREEEKKITETARWGADECVSACMYMCPLCQEGGKGRRGREFVGHLEAPWANNPYMSLLEDTRAITPWTGVHAPEASRTEEPRGGGGDIMSRADLLRLAGRGGRATHAAAEGDGLAGDLALEGSEDERRVVRRGRVEDVEAYSHEQRRSVVQAKACVTKGGRKEMKKNGDIPAQFTSLLGDGRLL